MNTNPDILEFKKERKIRNGLLLIIIGLAAIIGSGFPAWFEGLPLWVLPLFGWGCFIPGLWILFGLSTHRFNRKLGTVTSIRGVIVPFKSSKRPMSDFRTVVIYKERQSESRSRGTPASPGLKDRRFYYMYPVKLVCEDDPPEMNLVDLLDDSGDVLNTVRNLREHGVKLHIMEKERKMNGRASLTIGKPRSHAKALEMGQKLADFLDLRLCDLGVRK